MWKQVYEDECVYKKKRCSIEFRAYRLIDADGSVGVQVCRMESECDEDCLVSTTYRKTPLVVLSPYHK